jgi:hypothetical protein
VPSSDVPAIRSGPKTALLVKSAVVVKVTEVAALTETGKTELKIIPKSRILVRKRIFMYQSKLSLHYVFYQNSYPQT